MQRHVSLTSHSLFTLRRRRSQQNCIHPLYSSHAVARHDRLGVHASKRQRQGSQQKKKKNAAGLKKKVSIVLPESRDAAVMQGSEALTVAIQGLSKAKGLGKKESSVSPRIQVDIPIMDDSTEDMVQLARELMGHDAHSKKNIRYVTSQEIKSNRVDLTGVDVVMVIAPSTGDLKHIDALLRSSASNVVCVLLNPEWSQGNAPNECMDLVESFDAAYCFLPILIKPLMMPSMEGVVYRNASVDDGTGKPWKVFMIKPGTSGFDLVGQMGTRPSSQDVESILYNAIAASQKNPLKNLFGKQ